MLARVRTPPYPNTIIVPALALPDTPNSLLERGARRRRTACWRGCAPRPTLDTIIVPALALPDALNSLLERLRDGRRTACWRECAQRGRLASSLDIKAMVHCAVARSGTACCCKSWRLSKRAKQQVAPPHEACNL